ncbi:hypothetical protein M404DRAFT_993546 [Pisolithus tinctorius Marx 270]|uniref:Uncharacterized protein n=1 Tax=Pisolithus tinctorius Marx 270 TaxID=870435 RepID=A0A0C3JTS3_PISTI|nr:hypothetical protein M404DRAFT_993546 [Pisolithus tinctorius Marx 270]
MGVSRNDASKLNSHISQSNSGREQRHDSLSIAAQKLGYIPLFRLWIVCLDRNDM